MAAEPVLEATGLRVRYPVPGGRVTVLDGFDLTIRAHEIVGLIGDQGAGKSTAALALMGIVRPPGEIAGGAVRYGGADILTMAPEAARRLRGRDIGIIVQNPRGALNPMLRAGRQIGNAWLAHNAGTRRQADARAVDLLARVGINDPERRAGAYAHELSGGMAQRALIAMALSSNPRLLIADEPTSGLDVTIQAQVLDDIWRNVKATGAAVLLVTQDLGIAANYCDRVVVLHGGRIVEDRPVAAFFAAPEHPYSREVLRLQRAAAAGRATGAAAAGPALIRVEGLAKSFPVRGTDKVVQAVQGVSFEIGRGETLGLVGESGSGKTTVGRCLMRLAEPDAGEIRFAETPLAGLGPAAMRALRARLQIVFQDPHDSLNPRWTVWQILREPLDLHTRLSTKDKRARAAELLRLVGLDPAALDRRPRGMGSGALQRLSIARALATTPEFLVLDEPTSVLAPAARAELVALLRRLQAELGLSYLFISHDLTTVKDLCHRVAVMYLGQVVETGTVRQVFEAPLHPYARALLAAHLAPDPARRRVDGVPADALAGEIPSPIDLPRGCYLAGRCPHATDRCRAEPQPLVALGDGREVRCGRVARGEIGTAAAA
jgi:oligopeptide/dipeptide ABC transporter ATP-binding protein